MSDEERDDQAPRCIGAIEAGHARAVDELIFLRALLIGFDRGIEIDPEPAIALGFSDVYRCAAFRADDYIALGKPSQDLLNHIAALRHRALEFVKPRIE